MSGKSKGWLGTKRRVLCGYCGSESRYDNLRRHINTAHGKEFQFKYSVIEPKQNVLSLLKKKEEIPDNNNEQPEDESDIVKRIASESAASSEQYNIDIPFVDTSVEVAADDVGTSDGDQVRTEKRKIDESDDVGEYSGSHVPATKVVKVDGTSFEQRLAMFEETILKKVDQRMNNIEDILKDSRGDGDKERMMRLC